MKREFVLASTALLLAAALAFGDSAAAQVAPPMPTAFAARKMHGAAGTFDLPLSGDRTNPTTEPRMGPAHTILFTFDKPVVAGAAVVAAGVATAGVPTFAGNTMTVPLTGVADVQYVRVAVKNVVAADGGTGGAGGVTIGFLQGDVNLSRTVSLSDLLLVNALQAQPVKDLLFLFDINASGAITVADKLATNAGLTHTLPTPPPNNAPVASAGTAQAVTTGALVTLDGSASTDADGDFIAYAWTLVTRPAGSLATLASTYGVAPTFTPDLDGTYVASLVVTDGLASSSPSTVTVTASPASNAALRKDAARFMRQATFGATRDAIDALLAQGYAAWIDEQFGKPLVSHLATVQADPNLPGASWSVTMPSLWKQMFEGDDQLRQRVAFALSQIYVVSLNNATVEDAPCGGAAWLDLLNRNAFGNVRDLLRDVTLSPLMGEYLSMKESAKADPALQTQPDENYAREVMQLFSVGTLMLNLDGTVKLDGTGKPTPTYTEDTVKGLAKALSGWTFANQDQTKPWRWLYPDIWDADDVVRTQKACPAWSQPMQPWLSGYASADGARTIAGPAHDTGAKQLLAYPGAPHGTLPAGQTPQADLDDVIDNLFNHPNVGPFLAKQLIQRLVTSNPSPQYVARVAAKFNDNGSGVRGDMKAIVRAILLDDDARSASVAAQPSYGKLTEPVVRFVQLHRAFNAKRGSHYYDLWDLGAPTILNQSPLHAPSVFNFYHPDYAPAGPLTQAGLVGPEFEITHASSVAGFADFSKWGIINGFDSYNSDTSKWIAPDYSYYLTLATTPVQLVDELDVVLAAGGLNPSVKAAIAQAVGKVVWPSDPADNARERLAMALWLIVNSPDYSVQK